MSSKKPLRFAVSGALLVGSLSACGASDPEVNVAHPEVAHPEVNEAHDPELNEVEPVEPSTNEMPPQTEDQPTVNVLQAEPPSD